MKTIVENFYNMSSSVQFISKHLDIYKYMTHSQDKK